MSLDLHSANTCFLIKNALQYTQIKIERKGVPSRQVLEQENVVENNLLTKSLG